MFQDVRAAEEWCCAVVVRRHRAKVEALLALPAPPSPVLARGVNLSFRRRHDSDVHGLTYSQTSGVCKVSVAVLVLMQYKMSTLLVIGAFAIG